MKKQYDEIENVKTRIFDVTLLVGTIIGILTFVLSLRNFSESPIRFNYVLNLLTIIMLLVVYIFRNKLSQYIKFVVVIIGIFILSFVDIYKLGAYSTAKMLLVLIPFFSMVAYSTKRILFSSLFALLLYLFFAYLFTTGAIVTTIDLNIRNTRLSSWLVNITVISIVAFAMLTVVKLFNNAFFTLIKRLEEQNVELQAHRENLEGLVAERSEDLKQTNEELKATNEELSQSKSIIEDQNAEMKSTLEHLRETQTKLIQSEKMASLGVMSSGVAHEINNPLNFIMGGYTGLENYLKDIKIPSDKNVSFFLNSIRVGVERASEIVKALNQFSRNSESESQPCDINSIIDNCLIVLSNQYDNQLKIEKLISSHPIIVVGCSNELHQVFFNILSNSIQATNGVGTITINSLQKDSNVAVEITDNGCGIKKEHLDHVTDLFFTTHEPGKGTGLGLSIAYRIIKEHGGELDIESEEGKGTSVHLKFPTNNGAKTQEV